MLQTAATALEDRKLLFSGTTAHRPRHAMMAWERALEALRDRP